MDDEHEDGRSQFSVPVTSRLDRLDSLMRNLEGNQNLSGGDNSIRGVERQCMPLDLAVSEVHTKGSMLDRVASLENRLFQLCLEVEASSASSSSIVQTSGDTSSMHESSMDQSFRSLDKPDLRYDHENQNCSHRVLVNRFHFLGNSVDHRKERSTQFASGDDDDTSEIGKKRTTPNWRWKRLLGC